MMLGCKRLRPEQANTILCLKPPCVSGRFVCTHPKQVGATQFISVILNSNQFEFVRLVLATKFCRRKGYFLNNSLCQAKRIVLATCVSLFQASHGHKVA